MKNDKISVKRFGQDQLQKKKKKWIKPVVIGLVLTVIFAFLTLKGEDLIRSNIVKLSVDNDVNATWIGSLPEIPSSAYIPANSHSGFFLIYSV